MHHHISTMRPLFAAFVVSMAFFFVSVVVTTAQSDQLQGTFNFPKKSYTIREEIIGKFTITNLGEAIIVEVSYHSWNGKKSVPITKTVKLDKKAEFDIRLKPVKPGPFKTKVTVTQSGKKFKKVFSQKFTIISKGALKKKTPQEKTAERTGLRAQRTGGLPSPAATGPTDNCVSPPSGLVAWFPADGNAREVINGRHGALPTRLELAEGKIGQAFKFPITSGDANVFIIDPGSYELDITAPFTVEAWVQFLEEPGSGQAVRVFQKGSTSLAVGDLLYGRTETEGGYPWVTTRYSDDSALLRYEQPANTWIHVALTFDGRYLSAYRNGDREARGEAPLGFTIGQNDRSFVIGSNERLISWVPYLLDEIRVYNRELSEDELERIYNDGSASRCVPADPAPTACITPPADQVAWFTGDDTLIDSVGELEGTFSSYGSYGEGIVGNAFTKTAGPSPSSGLEENIFRIDDPGTTGFPLDLGNFTVEGWVKFSEVDGILYGGNILHKGGNYKLDGNGPHARIDGLSLVASANSPTIAANQWAHVASTYDGRRLNLYVNGALVGLGDAPGTALSPAPVNNERLAVGYYSLGAIDELSFYNRALDQREIDQIYRAGSLGKCLPAG